MAEHSVYGVPEAELSIADSGDYPGLGRLEYFLYSIGLGIANMALSVLLMDSPLALVVLLAAVGIAVWIIVQRLQNVGMNGWWTLAFVVPFLNIYIGLVCVAFPPGYQAHKTFDTAARVLIGLMVGTVVLAMVGMVAAVALPAMHG
jgi:uncharacterized membrane protein YhaH (DUF805 family)